MITTLKAIKKHKPCLDGWRKLLRFLGKTKDDAEQLSIVQILDSNGIEDALWCLRAVDGHEREIRLYAVWCARQVQHLMTDPRSVEALDVATKYAHGTATAAELSAACAAALAAKRAAWGAACAAARAAENAAWAAWNAARAAENAACAAENAALAAENAACAAACAAARAAERAACAAPSAAWADAWAATRKSQADKLREICLNVEVR